MTPRAQLLTIRDTAKELRCSEGVVRSLIRAGAFPVVILSARKRRVKLNDLENYINAKTHRGVL